MVVLTIASINVKAHPPGDMALEFNSSANILKVSITHGVEDNTSHYVVSVIISVNGTVDQNHLYTSQPDIAFFIYEYSVITNARSTIRVTAVCSETGSLTKTLGATPVDGEIPGYIGLFLVLIVSVISMLLLIRKKLKNV